MENYPMSYLESTAAEPQVAFPCTPPNRVPGPLPNRTKRSYASLIEILLSRPGLWFQINPEALSGATLRNKRQSLTSAARLRNLTIQTSVQDGSIYARIVVHAEAR